MLQFLQWLGNFISPYFFCKTFPFWRPKNIWKLMIIDANTWLSMTMDDNQWQLKNKFFGHRLVIDFRYQSINCYRLPSIVISYWFYRLIRPAKYLIQNLEMFHCRNFGEHLVCYLGRFPLSSKVEINSVALSLMLKNRLTGLLYHCEWIIMFVLQHVIS